jgi:hypothetical protein
VGDDWLDATAAAKSLWLPEKVVYRLIEDGKLSAVRWPVTVRRPAISTGLSRRLSPPAGRCHPPQPVIRRTVSLPVTLVVAVRLHQRYRVRTTWRSTETFRTASVGGRSGGQTRPGGLGWGVEPTPDLAGPRRYQSSGGGRRASADGRSGPVEPALDGQERARTDHEVLLKVIPHVT